MQQIYVNMPQKDLKLRNTYRERIELLQSRISLLAGDNRLLMTMYLTNGNSFRQIARLSGVSESTIARRIHKITQRLTDGEYISCLRNRDKFTRQQLDVARDYFLSGHSIRRIARKYDCTYYHVYKMIKQIRQIINC
jgi:predicted DNA-binding protein YlxM (UPF0122 family)